uniref:Uncharacterized protein n=1 Tax=Octopus bimaculoides TaxID=37653 RepID=A0A0L8H1X8_OCTBM
MMTSGSFPLADIALHTIRPSQLLLGSTYSRQGNPNSICSHQRTEPWSIHHPRSEAAEQTPM